MAFVLSSHDPILVLGGTGKVGRRIADQLASAAIPTLVASRSGQAPPNKWLTGVKFDWFDKATWENPWKAAGEHAVRAVHIIAPPVIDSALIMIQFVDFALTKGTRRFVLQSGTPLEAGDEWGMGQLHAYVRRLGNEGKADWAALRPTWFMGKYALRSGPRFDHQRD
jgi:festuclavine dehydrogenase